MQPVKLINRVNALPKNAIAGEAIPVKDGEALILSDAAASDLKPWDQAHQAWLQNDRLTFTEPDIDASAGYYPVPYNLQAVTAKGLTSKAEYETFLNTWPAPPAPAVWHLDAGFSQLRDARNAVGAIQEKNIVRIAHFDTGYDPQHKSYPKNLVRRDLQRNFVEGEDLANAVDPEDKGVLKMPGHGTGTLSLLAGARLAQPWCSFDDYFGLIDGVEIVPIRIAKGVVLLKTSAFIRAMDYVLNTLQQHENTRIHIITMSMGGVAAAAWADMVNQAYEQGIFMVTAAGNNFAKLPARTLVYPARFNRVVAACGVTYDYSPYHKDLGSFQIMEGNYGPRALMKTAVAAFTPNVPWAPYRFEDIVGIRGDGTSSATPQIAAAAALYCQKYFPELQALPQGWMRVEAIRYALFSSAKKTITGEDGDYGEFFVNGVLQANAMLNVPVPAAASLEKAAEDKVSFPFWRLILGIKGFVEEGQEGRQQMLETELMQLLLTKPQLQHWLKDEEILAEEMIDGSTIPGFIDAVLADPDASDTLKLELLKHR